MEEKDFNIKVNVIKEIFNDNREIVSSIESEELDIDTSAYLGGDIFTTANGEFVDLELQIVDFTEDELVKYVELAEALYERYEKRVSIYIVCPKDIHVCVNECEIESEAVFTIKLACIQEDSCRIILNGIKEKLKVEGRLDGDDLNALSFLQVMCKKEDRNYYRQEYLKIINRS